MTYRSNITFIQEVLASRLNQDVVLTLVTGQEVPCRIVKATKEGGDAIVVQQRDDDIVIRHSQVAMVRAARNSAHAA